MGENERDSQAHLTHSMSMVPNEIQNYNINRNNN